MFSSYQVETPVGFIFYPVLNRFPGRKRSFPAWARNPSAYSESMTFPKEKMRRERLDPRRRFRGLSTAGKLLR
jgi:hypothetical protein